MEAGWHWCFVETRRALAPAGALLSRRNAAVGLYRLRRSYYSDCSGVLGSRHVLGYLPRVNNV